jgi:hypothetical protein
MRDAGGDSRTRGFYEDSFVALLAASPEVAAEIGVAQIDGHAIAQNPFSDVSPAGEQHHRAPMAEALARPSQLPATWTVRSTSPFCAEAGSVGCSAP